MDDVIEGRLCGGPVIKENDFTVLMRSAFWAQGCWFVEDPVLSGLQSLKDSGLLTLLQENLIQGYRCPRGTYQLPDDIAFVRNH